MKKKKDKKTKEAIIAAFLMLLVTTFFTVLIIAVGSLINKEINFVVTHWIMTWAVITASIIHCN